MQRVKKNASREHRIDMDIVVDAYNEKERARSVTFKRGASDR